MIQNMSKYTLQEQINFKYMIATIYELKLNRIRQLRWMTRLLIKFRGCLYFLNADLTQIKFDKLMINLPSYTSNGGCRREEKSRKQWSLFTMLVSSVTEIFFLLDQIKSNCMYWLHWKSEKNRTEPNELDELKYSK